MATQARKIGRGIRILGTVLVALELVYLVAGNGILWTGEVARILSSHPEAMRVTYGRTYTVLPGRVHVSDFTARVQDTNTQFLLTADRARFDLNLFALVLKEVRATHVRVEGVGFRFVHKVHDVAGMKERLEAYPTIPGFARPPLVEGAPRPPAAPGEVLWTVHFDDVDAQVKQLWILEHRWEGDGRARGGFELTRMRTLQVWPSQLSVQDGALHVGKYVASHHPRFSVSAEVAATPVERLTGMKVFRPITGNLELEAKDFSPALLALYLPGLNAKGTGRLSANVRVEAGRFAPGSSMELKMETVRLETQGFRYEGAPRLNASLEALPRIQVTVPGAVVVPVPDGGDARVQLSGVSGDVFLSTADIASGLSLQRATARIQEGRVLDARAVRSLVTGKATFLVGGALGDGPLVLTGGVDHRPDVTIARLGAARLGNADLHGAARTGKDGWDGAAIGHIGPLPFGLLLKQGKLAPALHGSEAWLQQELMAAGLRFEEAAGAPP